VAHFLILNVQYKLSSHPLSLLYSRGRCPIGQRGFLSFLVAFIKLKFVNYEKNSNPSALRAPPLSRGGGGLIIEY